MVVVHPPRSDSNKRTYYNIVVTAQRNRRDGSVSVSIGVEMPVGSDMD